METKLHFVITKVDGEVITQDIGAPADQATGAINQMLAQYSQVGMLKKDGNKFILLPAAQIAKVEVELPSLVIANEGDATRAAQAVGEMKKIIQP